MPTKGIRKLSKLKAEINVDVSVENLWKIVSDYEHPSYWSPYIDSAVITSSVDSGVGATRTCTIPGFGDVEETISDWSDGVGFSINVEASGPLESARSTISVQPSVTGAVALYETEYSLREDLTDEEKASTDGYLRTVIAGSLLGLKHFAETGRKIGSVLPDEIDSTGIEITAA